MNDTVLGKWAVSAVDVVAVDDLHVDSCYIALFSGDVVIMARNAFDLNMHLHWETCCRWEAPRPC